MLAWAVLPTALGWTPTTVMTGSMEPRIHPGDVVVSRPVQADAAALGHVLLVDDPDHAGRLRLHRFAEFAPDGNLILRGDANSANDSTPVAPSAVHGVAVLRIPFVGLPIVWFAEKNWGVLAATLAAVAALTVAAASGSSTAPLPDDPEKPGEKPGEKPRPHGKPRIRRAIRPRVRATARKTRRIRAFLALATIPVLASLMTSATAHASFSAAAPTQTSSFSALASFPCQPATPLDSPYLFYPFNEGSGTVATDASGNARNGALQGTTTWVPGSCSPSPALTLNGSTGYVSTASSVAAPNIFTVEIWFKTTTSTGGKLIGFGNAQTGLSTIADRHLYMTDTGAIAFGAANRNGNSQNFRAATITSPKVGYNDGAWHVAAGTMSAAGATLYIDGKESVRISNSVVAERPYNGYWRIGYDTMDFDGNKDWAATPTSPFFAGTIDNAAVYSAALTADQVKAHYDAGH